MKFLGLVLVLVFGSGVWAHGFSRSSSNWQLNENGEVAVSFLVPAIAAESIPYGNTNQTAETRFEQHLQKTIKLFDEAQKCALEKLKVRQLGDKLLAQIKFKCERKNTESLPQYQIIIKSFFDSDPSHIHFARFSLKLLQIEQVFSSSVRTFKVDLNQKQSQTNSTNFNTFLSYVAIGANHILEGLDHLAFLIALLLVCGFTRAIFWAITGFTLGHSITLALASLDILTANQPMIEALIGWTILLMALEYVALKTNSTAKIFVVKTIILAFCLLASLFFFSTLTPVVFLGLMVFSLCWGFYIKDQSSHRKLVPIIAVGFGLIHGLGFASALAEIGLPPTYFLAALAGFNVGVELGQLAFVVILLGAVWLLRFVPRNEIIAEKSPYIISAILVGIGTYWFIGRSFF